MKKYIYIILLPVLFIVNGCSDWINVVPENSVTYESYFKSEKDAQALLFSLEVKVRTLFSPFASYTELNKSRNLDESYLPMMLSNFERYYETIASADIIIDNAFRFPLEEEVIKPYVLQAYFAKAAAYFALATDFGEVPIIKDGRTYKKYGKSSVSEVLDEAEKWALKAMELPNYENLKLGDLPLCKQYASKGAATALLAHIYAWRAGVEGKTEYWEKAEDLCSQIIENKVGNYALEENPVQLCLSGLHKDSKESIWEYYRELEEQGSVFYYQGVKESIGFPIIVTVDPTTEPDYYLTKEQVRELYDVEDGRREAYFWATDADSIFVKKVGDETIVDTERGTEGEVTARWGNQDLKWAFPAKYRYPCYKYYSWSATPIWSGMDQNVSRFRLAEIILLRAECRVRQGKDNAKDDLNAVRQRAYAGSNFAYQYPNADDVEKGLDKDLQLAIFREREKELLMEGHRYYDARRNGVEYVQRFFKIYSYLSPQDIEEGALYQGIVATAFSNNDLLRQNVYWNKRTQNQ